MNVINIRAQSRFKSGIDNTTTLTNAEILTLANLGYHLVEQELYKLNQDFFNKEKHKFSLVANQDLYSLPTDFIGLKQVRLAYTAPSNEEDYEIADFHDPASTIDIEVQEEDVDSDNPTYHLKEVAGTYYVRIKPTPSSNSTNGGEIYYFARNADLSATGDALSIPTDYHDLIPTYVAKEATLKYEMWDKYKILKNEWDEGIFKMKQALAVMDTNRGGRMRNILEDGKAGTSTTTELWK